MTIREYYNINEKNQEPFISILEENKPNWYDEYIAYHTVLDYTFLNKKYADLIVDVDFEERQYNPNGVVTNSLLVGDICLSFKRELERIYQTLSEEYNPLHNYDSTEEIVNSGTDSNNNTLTNTFTKSGTVNNTNSTNVEYAPTTSNANTKSIKANISGSMVESEKNVSTMSGKDTTNSSATNTESYTDYNEQTNSTNNATTTYGHKISTKRFGNIGTTKSQTMALDEISLRKLSFYDYLYHRILLWITSGTFECEV